MDPPEISNEESFDLYNFPTTLITSTEFIPTELSGLQDISSSRIPISSLTPVGFIITIVLFIVAGILEIGGSYLVWIGLREKRFPKLYIPLGCITLICYGFVPCLQPLDNFGRLFAIYGGFFIVLSFAWAYWFDGFKMDVGDGIGSIIAIIGVAVIWFWPR
eukprot:gene8874-11971_t